MQRQYKRIGICGGTFDPIHFGHLKMAALSKEKFSLDRIVFIPTGTPPHKQSSEVTHGEKRFQMLQLAVDSIPGFEASRIEIDRVGFTYTVDTLMELKRVFGSETELFFIVGADVVKDLLTWKNWKTVFTLCHFIAVLRPGFEVSNFEETVKQLKNHYGVEISELEAPLIPISSSLIREKVAQGQPIGEYVPERVERYILDHELYIKRGEDW